LVGLLAGSKSKFLESPPVISESEIWHGIILVSQSSAIIGKQNELSVAFFFKRNKTPKGRTRDASVGKEKLWNFLLKLACKESVRFAYFIILFCIVTSQVA